MSTKSEWSPSFCANELLKQLDRRGVTPRHVADAIAEPGGATLDGVAHTFIHSAFSEPTKTATLDIQTKDLIAELREWCRSQKELWRRVPYLALEADGRTGYSDDYTKAYNLGYWPVASNRGLYTVYVDCATGELIRPSDPATLAFDEEIFPLLLNPATPDAERAITELKKEAQKPYWKGYDEKEQIRWRNNMRRALGLRRLYTRKEHYPAFIATV